MTPAEGKPTFAFQGAPGAFSHSAGQMFAKTLGSPGEPGFVPCQTFEEIFQTVTAGGCEYGVVPLENSSIGSITANYDLLWRCDVEIVGEVSMPVHHQLIGLAGADPAALKEIYSHPAALDQCRKLFAGLSGVRPVAYFDTSGAARFVKETGDPSLAAIAGEAAADEHGLVVLRTNVEDYPDNSTRFGIVTRRCGDLHNPREFPEPPYKISCAIQLPHKPGSLARVLDKLAEQEVNLTKIESRPIPEAAWHYRFFIDIQLDGQTQDAFAVAALKSSCESCKLLGRYRPWGQ